jgi:hypothetical protein
MDEAEADNSWIAMNSQSDIDNSNGDEEDAN